MVNQNWLCYKQGLPSKIEVDSAPIRGIKSSAIHYLTIVRVTTGMGIGHTRLQKRK